MYLLLIYSFFVFFFITEKEILELADDRLWEKASCLAPYDLADEIMDYPEERK